MDHNKKLYKHFMFILNFALFIVCVLPNNETHTLKAHNLFTGFPDLKSL